MDLKHVIEALVFASQKPLTSKEVAAVLRSALEAEPDNEAVVALAKVKQEEIEAAFDALRLRYDEAGAAFCLVQGAQGWQVVTRPECAAWVKQLFPENRPTRLSAPALETLAIIAYRQPITRADLEAVRGVSVDGVMQTLLDRGLVKIAGRADVPGRPLLYETTTAFLDHFGMKSLDELPNADELRRVELPKAQGPPGQDTGNPQPQTEMQLDMPDAKSGGSNEGSTSENDGKEREQTAEKPVPSESHTGESANPQEETVP